MTTIHTIPKAELHVHLEGAVRPALIREIAQKRGVDLPHAIMCADTDTVKWSDFSEFHVIYDAIASVLKTDEDFYTIALDYFEGLAKTNTQYSEVIISPYVAKANGVAYEVMQSGLVAAADEAKRRWGLTARYLLSIHRHEGPAKADHIVREAMKVCHEYVVGANIAGDTIQHRLSVFKTLCRDIKSQGLGLSVHAGESTPASEMIEALDVLKADRIGHGVRCVEDEAVLARVVDEQVMLEVCPSSNIVLDFYKDYEHHPLHLLKKRGANVSLNSDDPTFFGAWLEDEYQVAMDHFGYTALELEELTRRTMAARF